jgi:hypothetical protein
VARRMGSHRSVMAFVLVQSVLICILLAAAAAP